MVKFNIKWYERLLKNTNEKEVLVNKIASLLEGKSHESCLEIGLGTSPYYARRLSKYFKKYVIIENRLIKTPIPKTAELINEDWEKSDFNDKFDVIIASHVIYYFKDKEKSIRKILQSLNNDGRAYFVVNGKEADYGPLKAIFSEFLGEKYVFTYDELMNLIKDSKFREYTIPSTIHFNSYDELFETLRITFDHYPKEYEKMKDKMIKYLENHIKGSSFNVDQKIIEVYK